MAAGGGTSQTAVNRLAGARSQLAELLLRGRAGNNAVSSPLIASMPASHIGA